MAKKPAPKRRTNKESLNRGLRQIQEPSINVQLVEDSAPVDALTVPKLNGNNLPQMGIDLAAKLAKHVPLREAYIEEILKNTQAETESFQRIARLTKESREATEITERAMSPKNL